MTATLELPIAPPAPGPDVVEALHTADIWLLNSSGGKDSQAMLAYVTELAGDMGALDRLVVVHCDLGHVEWPGTLDLAAEQAEGLRFEVVRREQGDLLQQIRERNETLRSRPGDDGTARPWPWSGARYCTSDQKRAPVRKLITRLVGELGLSRQARVVNMLGLRGAESVGRRRLPALTLDKAATSGVREVLTWLPIHAWTETQVWEAIRASDKRHHFAYDLGMDRLSCSLCVLARRADLVRAARLRPELAAEYLELEETTGHPFWPNLSMRQIVAEAGVLFAAECEALFASALQPSQQPSVRDVLDTVTRVRAAGGQHAIDVVATAYGYDAASAAVRMSWCRDQLDYVGRLSVPGAAREFWEQAA